MVDSVPSRFLDLLSVFQPFHLRIRIGHFNLQLNLVPLFNLVGWVQLFEECCERQVYSAKCPAMVFVYNRKISIFLEMIKPLL